MKLLLILAASFSEAAHTGRHSGMTQVTSKFLVMLLAKILAFSAHPIKHTETQFGGNRKVAFNLN